MSMSGLLWSAVILCLVSQGVVAFLPISGLATAIFDSSPSIRQVHSALPADSLDEPFCSSDAGEPEAWESGPNEFEGFDYLKHWYPVLWEEDMPKSGMFITTLFDTDYFVTGNVDDNGRTSYSALQFPPDQWDEGSNHIVIDHEVPVPALHHQGLVWIYPGGGDIKSALENPPPIIPEMFQTDGNRVGPTLVRDFPVDWSILVDNILDLETGLSSFGDYRFKIDANNTEAQSVNEESSSNGWTITATSHMYQHIISTKRNKAVVDRITSVYPPRCVGCTTKFMAPGVVSHKLTDKFSDEDIETWVHWVCPVGAGRSRLLSASIAKPSIFRRRWFAHMTFNRYLDSISLSLGAQQEYFLNSEHDTIRSGERYEEEQIRTEACARKNGLCQDTSLQRMTMRVANFWDSTLQRVPNRVGKLAERDPSARDASSICMDRASQHLALCPDSKRLVKWCNRAKLLSGASTLHVFSLMRTWRRTTRTLIYPAAVYYTYTPTPAKFYVMMFASAGVFRVAQKLRNDFTRKRRWSWKRQDKRIPSYLWGKRLSQRRKKFAKKSQL